MYLHLGGEVLIRTRDIIGIFDLENTSTSKRTKEFLVEAAKKKQVKTVSYEIPKSFVLTKENSENKVYISQISISTLKKRQKK